MIKSLLCTLLALRVLFSPIGSAENTSFNEPAAVEHVYTQELAYGSFTLRIPYTFSALAHNGSDAVDKYIDGESGFQLYIAHGPSFQYKNTGELIEYCLERLRYSYSYDSRDFAKADECLAIVSVSSSDLMIDIYNRGEGLAIAILPLDHSWNAVDKENALALAYELLDHISAPEIPLK